MGINLLLGLFLSPLVIQPMNSEASDTVHIYEIKEIILNSRESYFNPYAEVTCWVELEGPDFRKKVYGFWNGNDEFVVRVVATVPGEWTYRSFSNTEDPGLNGQTGSFSAVAWSEAEIGSHPNRRGFLRATANGRALEYADGTSFFMLGDTWWSAPTWRFPLRGITADSGYVPGPGISFEEAVAFRKRQRYNTVAMVAAFPNWKVDEYPDRYVNADTIGVRQAWKKNGQATAKDMHDEAGNRPFMPWTESDVIADYDRINPEYFKSLDKKIAYLQEEGMVSFLETVRRDHGPTWKHYFDWPRSFTRYVQYIIARYGAYNIIFSGIHQDWIIETFGLPSDDFNEALTDHYREYGGLPYGQPSTILIQGSTYREFGHGEEAPWLTMHSVGNGPRHHGFYPMIEEIFALDPPYPVANLEPYYPGWDNPNHNNVAGERPEPGGDRDNYFARAQMYGSVLSGALAGHIYGTGAYDGNTTGEPREDGERPYIWDGLNYSSGAQMEYLGKFIQSEGDAYREMTPQKEMLDPYKSPESLDNGLDGWSFVLTSKSNDLLLIYFEHAARIPVVSGLLPDREYRLSWFDPRKGEWLETETVRTEKGSGQIALESFPGGSDLAQDDWCLKLKVRDR